MKLDGEGPVRLGCFAAGERSPWLAFEAPDLAFLAAATLHLADRPHQFRWQRGADHRLHLTQDRYKVDVEHGRLVVRAVSVRCLSRGFPRTAGQGRMASGRW